MWRLARMYPTVCCRCSGGGFVIQQARRLSLFTIDPRIAMVPQCIREVMMISTKELDKQTIVVNGKRMAYVLSMRERIGVRH
jgi:hypothetical protein